MVDIDRAGRVMKRGGGCFPEVLAVETMGEIANAAAFNEARWCTGSVVKSKGEWQNDGRSSQVG